MRKLTFSESLKTFLTHQYVEYIALLIIITVSSVVRIKFLSNYPYGLEGDEFGWTIHSILYKSGINPEDARIFSLYSDLVKIFPVSVYFQKLSFLIFGQDIISPRKILVIVTAFGLFFFYKLLRLFTSRFPALVTTTLFYLSTYKILLSMIAFQTPFMDPFVWGSLYFAIRAVSSDHQKKYQWLSSFLCGVFLSIALLTYNIVYLLLPSLCLFFVLSFLILRFSVNSSLRLLSLFLLPIFLSAIIWLPGLFKLVKILSYADVQSVIHLSDKTIHIRQLFTNAEIAFRQLFIQLVYENNDMIINYPNTLIPREISFFAVLGVATATCTVTIHLLRKKTVQQHQVGYILLLCVLWVNTLPNILLQGTLFPRMWFINIGIVFLFTAIFIQFCLKTSSRLSLNYLIGGVIFIYSSFLSYQEVARYVTYTSSGQQPSFFITHRDIFLITQQFAPYKPSEMLYVYQTSSYLDNIIIPAVIVQDIPYYSGKAPYYNSDLNILNEQEVMQVSTEKFSTVKYLAFQDELYDTILSLLKQHQLCSELDTRLSTFVVFHIKSCDT